LKTTLLCTAEASYSAEVLSLHMPTDRQLTPNRPLISPTGLAFLIKQVLKIRKSYT